MVIKWEPKNSLPAYSIDFYFLIILQATFSVALRVELDLQSVHYRITV